MSNIAYRIHKRLFNPSTPEAKNVRVLVAQFTRTCELEANLMFHHLQKLSTDFKGHNDFQKYRYYMTKEPEEVKSRFADLQIDTEKAKTTNRPITYQLSWENKGGRCYIMAYTKLHGTVRAEINDEPIERQRFVRLLKQVWPNATQSSK